MSGMDGYELIDHLRTSGFTMPILIITAKERFEDKQRGFQAGTDDYMVKPIDVNEMVLRVGALLTRQQLMDEIWGLDSTTDERTVDVHVNRLRERFKNCDDFIIMTVRGLGYKAVKTEA